MFLHSGASLHGHEYSNKPLNQHPQPAHRRSPLLRSAFTSPTPVVSASSSVPYSARNGPFPTTSTTTSTTTNNNNNNNNKPLAATASPPVSIVRSHSTFTNSPRPRRPRRPSLHDRPVSEDLFGSQRPPEPVVRFHDPVVVLPSPPALRSTSTAAVPVSPAPSALRLRPPQEPMSDDDRSISASEASYASDVAPGSVASSKPRRRRIPRKSTTFLFAHPAPKLSTKKHILQRIRPTLLMQMQQLSSGRRPLPVIDVYPATMFAGNVVARRLSKRSSGLFGISGELGLHDTILMRSEDYDAQSVSSESDADDDSFEHRTLVAVLRPLRRGDRSEIVLADGTVWTTTSLPNGSFDFVRVDALGHTTTARWVRRAGVKPLAATLATAAAASEGTTPASSSPEANVKFTFSIIDPQSRRHPILATLTSTTLDVLDHYTTVSPLSSGHYPPSRTRVASPSPVPYEEETSNDEEQAVDERSSSTPRVGAAAFTASSTVPAAKGRTTLPVDGALRDFISSSAIWVALQCGWAQCTATPNGCTPYSPSGAASIASGGGGLRSASGSLSRPFEQQANENFNAGEAAAANRGRRRLSRAKEPLATIGQAQARDHSPSLSARGSFRSPISPRKTSSTGGMFMKRRKQPPLSDTSDSELPSRSSFARRSRAFSRLSSDYTSKLSPTPSQSPSPSEVAVMSEPAYTKASPPPSTRQQPTRRTTTSAMPAAAPRTISTPALPHGGRSVSAYYASNPLLSPDGYNGTVDPRGPGSTSPKALGGVDGVGRGATAEGMPWKQRPGSVIERGIGTPTRWKKLGSWFKKLGGH
ncbi:hypothetical protein SPI_04352 [Niveomyces insectorum RCEF 264]|uniref:Uncharacterized protein n=1 Tax=Niveomyces insectorum RCEF 264 TaxID=1081102 RepID=A0A162J2C9_9HYPO|nr:hypothetical protein SPI_04352 [Niveomyces insectorum RCEF 264]